MSSSKVSPSLTDQTSTEQTSSILNNNYVKIGGAIFVFFIFVIILYRSFSSSQSSQSQRRVDRFACILYPACDFLDSISDVNKDLIIKEYPDIDINMVQNNIIIINHDRQEFNNVYIQSIRSQGYIITGYSGPNFFGEKYIFQDDKKTGNIELKCIKLIEV
jgi:hypothetical protein